MEGSGNMYGVGGWGNYARQGQVNNQQWSFDKGLAGGIKGGRLNKNEANRLFQYDQATHQLEGEYLKDGQLSPQERQTLARRNRYNQKMMGIYSRGDYQPSNMKKPQNAVERRMQNQFNRTFNGLHNGSMTTGEGAKSLYNQGNNATEYGRVSWRSPWSGRRHMSGGGNRYMHGRLNNSSRQIYNMKHNWQSDFGSPLPRNMSWGSPFGGMAWRGFPF